MTFAELHIKIKLLHCGEESTYYKIGRLKL